MGFSLDLGAHDGSFMVHLEGLLHPMGKEYHIIGIDIHPRNNRIQQMNIEQAVQVFGPASFDLVTLNRPGICIPNEYAPIGEYAPPSLVHDLGPVRVARKSGTLLRE